MASRADNFDRADNSGPLGTPSDAGSAWVEPGGPLFQIVSHQANRPASSVGAGYLETSSANGDVQVTLIGTCTDHGLVGRYTDASNYWYGSGRSTGSYLQKIQGGSYTSFGPYTGAVTGDVMKMTLSGNSVSLYLNGVLLTTQNDSFNSTATKHGIATGNAVGTFEDFSFTDAVATPDTPELYGAPFGSLGRRQTQQLLSQ